jgi:hypothetical protein
LASVEDTISDLSLSSMAFMDFRLFGTYRSFSFALRIFCCNATIDCCTRIDSWSMLSSFLRSSVALFLSYRFCFCRSSNLYLSGDSSFVNSASAYTRSRLVTSSILRSSLIDFNYLSRCFVSESILFSCPLIYGSSFLLIPSCTSFLNWSNSLYLVYNSTFRAMISFSIVWWFYVFTTFFFSSSFSTLSPVTFSSSLNRTFCCSRFCTILRYYSSDLMLLFSSLRRISC